MNLDQDNLYAKYLSVYESNYAIHMVTMYVIIFMCMIMKMCRCPGADDQVAATFTVSWTSSFVHRTGTYSLLYGN